MAGWMGFIKTPLRGVRIAWYSRARSRSLLTARVLTRVGVLESRLRFDSRLLWMFNRVPILPLRDQRQRARLVTRLQRQRRSGVRKLTFSPCQNRGSAHRRGRLREWRAGGKIRGMRRRDCIPRSTTSREKSEKSEIFPFWKFYRSSISEPEHEYLTSRATRRSRFLQEKRASDFISLVFRVRFNSSIDGDTFV